MIRKFLLVLLIAMLVGLPVFAQPMRDEPSGSGGTEEAYQDGNTIRINQPSDEEFNRALQSASDIELVTDEPAKTGESGKTTDQEGKK
jgi:hypothetical protein